MQRETGEGYCVTCKWFDPMKSEKIGYCRVDSPRIEDATLRAAWPVSKRIDWCGKHEPGDPDALGLPPVPAKRSPKLMPKSPEGMNVRMAAQALLDTVTKNMGEGKAAKCRVGQHIDHPTAIFLTHRKEVEHALTDLLRKIAPGQSWHGWPILMSVTPKEVTLPSPLPGVLNTSWEFVAQFPQDH